MQNINILVIKHIFQVLAILIFLENLVYLEHFLFGDPAVAVGDLLEAGDLCDADDPRRSLQSSWLRQRLSCVPVSSQVKPCPSSSTFRVPFSR